MMSRYDTEDEYESPKRLPPISEGLYQDNQESPTSSRRRNNTSPNTARKMTVSERLYDPDYKKNRQIPKEPEPVYVREFKSKPPKNLEHVTSRHMDASYYEPKGEYVLEETEEWPPQFKHRVPKRLENVQSRHLSPEYHRKRVPRDNSPDDSPVFVARPPKKLEHVQSRIMDQRYFAERSNNEDKQEKYDTEFKARLPKKLEHVQSRILDPKKPKPVLEEEDVYQTNFKAKPPKQLGHVGSRILDPSFYEPRSEYVYEKEEEFDTSFKAKLPRSLQHVDTRIYDERYYKKKIPPITSEDRVVENMQTDFKAKLPRSMQHVQSRAFDPAYNKQLATPRNDSPVLELKSKGSFVLINVKKDAHGNPIRSGYANRLTEEKMGDKIHFNQGRKDFYGKKNDIKGDKRSGREPENNKNNNGNGDETPTEKPKRKPYKPPQKPKPEKIDRDFFDSWVMTPTHIVNDSEDMFYRNRQNVSQMWNSLAKTIHKTVIENGDRVQAYDRAYYR